MSLEKRLFARFKDLPKLSLDFVFVEIRYSVIILMSENITELQEVPNTNFTLSTVKAHWDARFSLIFTELCFQGNYFGYKTKLIT